MNLCIKIADRSNVTVDSVQEFLRQLKANKYIDDNSVEYVSDEYFDIEKNIQLGGEYYADSVEDALKIINEIGTKNISISLDYRNHYLINGRPDGSSQLDAIMYYLNVASREVAQLNAEDISTDFYHNVIFQSGVYGTEWGNMEICELSLGGEGGYIDEEHQDEAISIMRDVMKKECPSFDKLIEMMNSLFGETQLVLEPAEY